MNTLKNNGVILDSNFAQPGGTYVFEMYFTLNKGDILSEEGISAVPKTITYSTEPSMKPVPVRSDKKEPWEVTNVVFEQSRNLRHGIVLNDELLFNLRKLSEIRSLKDGWDGNGASAFSTKLIEKVNRILLFLDVQPEVFPTADDSIQLEYDGPNKSYLEFQIFETDDIEVFCINRDGSEKEWSIKSDIKSLNGVVKDFYG